MSETQSSEKTKVPPTTLELFVLKDGQRLGPYTEEEVLAKVDDGTLSESDVAMVEGKTGWLPLASFIVREPAEDAGPQAAPRLDSMLKPVSEAASRKWHYADSNNQAVGPFTTKDMLKLRSAGIVRDQTLVFEEGGSEWTPLAVILPILPPPQAAEPVANPGWSPPPIPRTVAATPPSHPANANQFPNQPATKPHAVASGKKLTKTEILVMVLATIGLGAAGVLVALHMNQPSTGDPLFMDVSLSDMLSLYERLNLTDDQHKKFIAIMEKYNAQFEALATNQTLTKEEKRVKMLDTGDIEQEDLVKLLTSEQRAQCMDEIKKRPVRRETASKNQEAAGVYRYTGPLLLNGFPMSDHGVRRTMKLTWDLHRDGTFVFEKDTGYARIAPMGMGDARTTGSWKQESMEVIIIEGGKETLRLKQDGEDLIGTDGTRFIRIR